VTRRLVSICRPRTHCLLPRSGMILRGRALNADMARAATDQPAAGLDARCGNNPFPARLTAGGGYAEDPRRSRGSALAADSCQCSHTQIDAIHSIPAAGPAHQRSRRDCPSAALQGQCWPAGPCPAASATAGERAARPDRLDSASTNRCGVFQPFCDQVHGRLASQNVENTRQQSRDRARRETSGLSITDRKLFTMVGAKWQRPPGLLAPSRLAAATWSWGGSSTDDSSIPSLSLRRESMKPLK